MPDSVNALGPSWLPGELAGGRILPIVLHPDPILRETCKMVGYLTAAEMRNLVADLLATMYAAGGRGLAAPQIGISRRAFVMDASWKEGQPEPMVFLDPEVRPRSDQRVGAVEQCLSIPDRPIRVKRPDAVEIVWFDLDGHRQSRMLHGIQARIAQHEYDHLDGRLIVDYE